MIFNYTPPSVAITNNPSMTEEARDKAIVDLKEKVKMQSALIHSLLVAGLHKQSLCQKNNIYQTCHKSHIVFAEIEWGKYNVSIERKQSSIMKDNKGISIDFWPYIGITKADVEKTIKEWEWPSDDQDG